MFCHFFGKHSTTLLTQHDDVMNLLARCTWPCTYKTLCLVTVMSSCTLGKTSYPVVLQDNFLEKITTPLKMELLSESEDSTS